MDCTTLLKWTTFKGVGLNVTSNTGNDKKCVFHYCSYYRCSFDANQGGEMVQQEYERFMKHEEAEEETVTV